MTKLLRQTFLQKHGDGGLARFNTWLGLHVNLQGTAVIGHVDEDKLLAPDNGPTKGTCVTEKVGKLLGPPKGNGSREIRVSERAVESCICFLSLKFGRQQGRRSR